MHPVKVKVKVNKTFIEPKKECQCTKNEEILNGKLQFLCSVSHEVLMIAKFSSCVDWMIMLKTVEWV